MKTNRTLKQVIAGVLLTGAIAVAAVGARQVPPRRTNRIIGAQGNP